MVVTYVKVPKFTFTMEDALITKWLKNEGEIVNKGEPICEVESEKTTEQLLAQESGSLRKIVVSSNWVVPVDEVIAVIAEPNEKLNVDEIIERVKKVIKPGTGNIVPLSTPEPVETRKKPIAGEGIRISPVARNLAEEYKIDITNIEGSGPGGRIVRYDVLKAVEDAEATKIAASPGVVTTTEVKIKPLVGIRKVIAERLSYSAHTAVQVPITMDVDMSEAQRFREMILPIVEEKTKFRVTITDIIIKAVAKALEENPLVNSWITGEEIKISTEVNVGVATSLENGLIVPVIYNANKKTLSEIVSTARELVEKARTNTLSTKEVSESTFTISNLGMFDVDIFAPVINPPESAILGVGRIVQKPVVVNNEIVARPMMTLTLVWDHRVMDGVIAAKFLGEVKNLLETPYLLLV